MSMNPDVKALWVQELRELDNDRQGRLALRDGNDKMCCLGVLSEIAVGQGVIPEATFLDNGDGQGLYGYFDGHGTGEYDLERAYLPEPVRKWAGLATVNPMLNSLEQSAAGANDGGRYNFDKMADAIEVDL